MASGSSVTAVAHFSNEGQPALTGRGALPTTHLLYHVPASLLGWGYWPVPTSKFEAATPQLSFPTSS